MCYVIWHILLITILIILIQSIIFLIFKIEDYKKRLYKAKDEYEKFVRNEKIDFELYVGDEVKIN